jgi:predicted nucleic acid-binding protein
MPSPVVIDANLAIYNVLKTPHSSLAVRVMNQLTHEDAQLFAPGLWWFEVTSVVHNYRSARLISDATAYSALELLTKEWGIQRIEVPERSAFDWATRLRQKAAYDGFYLAAAEQLGAEFWTADKALANNAGQLGVSWVHWMGEIE